MNEGVELTTTSATTHTAFLLVSIWATFTTELGKLNGTLTISALQLTRIIRAYHQKAEALASGENYADAYEAYNDVLNVEANTPFFANGRMHGLEN